MEYNETIWSTYQPGYVDPMYVPYMRTYIKDPWGNNVSTNTWQQQSLQEPTRCSKPVVDNFRGRECIDSKGNKFFKSGYSGSPTGIVDPALFRLNWGMSFMNMFADDPCPSGYEKAPGGYCVKSSRDAEPVFYTDKAFVAKNQYFDSYADTRNKERRTSQQTDLRSVNPLTGQYTVYFRPNVAQLNTTRYGKVSTKDSYLA